MLAPTGMKINATTTTRLLLAALTLLPMAVPACAQEPAKSASAYEIKVPETAKDHYEMAEYYQKIAAQNRKEIEMHKKMLADFAQTVAKNPKAGENPYLKNMRLHCERFIKAADALLAEASESAKFHTLRAKEMEGK